MKCDMDSIEQTATMLIDYAKSAQVIEWLVENKIDLSSLRNDEAINFDEINKLANRYAAFTTTDNKKLQNILSFI